MVGKDGGIDDRFARAAAEGFGAFILGRNMFGPAGDDWGGPDWKGWWGDNPPYPRADLHPNPPRPGADRDGGRDDLPFRHRRDRGGARQAKAAAGDLDVKIGGGVSTIRQYLLAGAIDEMHLALSPVVLGRGESLFAGIDLPGLGYRVTEVVPTELATHLVLTALTVERRPDALALGVCCWARQPTLPGGRLMSVAGEARKWLGYAPRSQFDTISEVDPSPAARRYALMTSNRNHQSRGNSLMGERVERRLAAVLAADVAGYSRLMGLDEEGTLARLKAARRAVVDPALASHHRGRIVKTTCDGMLVEFASAVDAVRSSLEVQRSMAEQNAAVSPDQRIEFRIGIHVR